MSQWVYRVLGASAFPWGTLVVNMLGCLLIGFLYGMVEMRQGLWPAVRLFVFVGILGGFTTYSSFALESVNLVREQYLWGAFTNVALQMVLGLFLVVVGLQLAKFT